MSRHPNTDEDITETEIITGTETERGIKIETETRSIETGTGIERRSAEAGTGQTVKKRGELG